MSDEDVSDLLIVVQLILDRFQLTQLLVERQAKQLPRGREHFVGGETRQPARFAQQ